MNVNLESFEGAFHRNLNIEFRLIPNGGAVTRGEHMDDELKRRWDSLEVELRAAMAKLSEAIEKAREEMPAAAKAINDEYLRVQNTLDKAVDKLRK